MWIRISKIDIKQVDATHLGNPKNEGSPMTLALYQQESRTAFFVSKNKKVFAEYLETSAGTLISRRKWTSTMKEFAQQELAKLPPQKGVFRLTVFGWIFFLLALSFLGYLAYQEAQEPAKQAAYQQDMTEKANVAEGDIYFGRYRVYKEKGNMIGSEGGFGWFKVVKIENDTYHIAKSVEVSKTAKAKEDMNSTDFEQETSAVKAKELEAYIKHFLSEDGLIEFNFDTKKN